MRWDKSALAGVLMLGVVLSGQVVEANNDDDRQAPQSVTVAFGAGLNTAQPGNSLNHHVLPRVVTVRTRLATPKSPAVPGVVNFMVGGFHQIYVYHPDVKLKDIEAYVAKLPPPPTGLFINYLPSSLLYEGVNPANLTPAGELIPGANPGGPAPSPLLDAGLNRIEQVGFTVPGLYLVICNVTPHFRDGMIAFVRVVAEGRDRDDDYDDDDHRKNRRDDDDDHRKHRGRD